MIRVLSDILTPAAHIRIIARLTAEIDTVTPGLNTVTLKRIEWNVNEYVKKAGELPPVEEK